MPQLRQDPYAECVEAHSTHTGMGFDPLVYELTGPQLAAQVTGTIRARRHSAPDVRQADRSVLLTRPIHG